MWNELILVVLYSLCTFKLSDDAIVIQGGNQIASNLEHCNFCPVLSLLNYHLLIFQETLYKVINKFCVIILFQIQNLVQQGYLYFVTFNDS